MGGGSVGEVGEVGGAIGCGSGGGMRKLACSAKETVLARGSIQIIKKNYKKTDSKNIYEKVIYFQMILKLPAMKNGIHPTYHIIINVPCREHHGLKNMSL